ncbi:dihydrolipoamide acetyltransferase family protein [Sulfitobacter sabulilitoris]|uniref:Dihydrolipoamide acetyltransferase component of pyruvate dehydrogenase complex n=1 Tax=Sulfitobacter sabulilitoris TaxID=2562655 RepID=A0A5S3PIU9_9RHOB|nr:dihydrolipoamide acetyltransferase family protein [Sulfitobacter sabulilitoris]TMM54221.1 2-oxo acid dehydrogenase subunit E2 [Sulfitobacter sabulilitoris]
MTVFVLPDLGEGLQEAEIVAWHVSEGDHVMADQPLLSVETDKAVVEIPAPYPGRVTHLLAAVGDVVPTGGALIEIGTGGGKDTGAIVGDLATAQPPSASPAVRSLARQHGVDLADLTGTGPNGAIVSADVLAAAQRPRAGEELRGVRRAMARAMAQSHAVVVPATVMDHADIGAWPKDADPTLRLIRAVCVACRAEPALNAWYDGTRRHLHDHVDLALAMDTPEGLFAPVLRAADGDPDIAGSLAALKTAVRDRSIAPEALKAATFTLSNFGMIGGVHAVLVVSTPQVAILGAGRISRRAVVTDGQIAARRVLPLSLTFDHRVVTGGEAARFLAALRGDLETPSAGSHG